MSIFDSRTDSAFSRTAPWPDPGIAVSDDRTGISGQDLPPHAAPNLSSSPMTNGEYVCIGVAQQCRVNEAPVSLPAPSANTTNAPSHDLNQLGKAFGTNRPPQMLWTDAGVNASIDAGRRQGGLSDAQSQANASLAAAAVTSLRGSIPASQAPLAPVDMAKLVQASGIPYPNQDPAQLISATRYINRATDPTDQQVRIAKALDGFHILSTIGSPRLGGQEMKELLWNAANVPGHAFGKMSDVEIAARYQDVAAALNIGGKQEVKIGKHVLKVNVDESGQVTETSTKKPGWFKTFLKGALTVASFIPVTAPFAAVANAAWSAYEGIKNKNWFQAIAGAGGALASGVTAFAGNVTSGAAATTVKIADAVAKGATAAQAGFNAAHGQDAMGMFTGIVGAVSNGAGAIANGAGKIADVARDVQQWAKRVGDGVTATNSFRKGDIGVGISQSATLASGIAGDFRNKDGSLKSEAVDVKKVAAHAVEGGRIVSALEQHDDRKAVTNGWNLFRDIFFRRDNGSHAKANGPGQSALNIVAPNPPTSHPSPAWMQAVDVLMRIFSGDKNAIPQPKPPYILN